MTKSITSTQNSLIKELVQLKEKSKVRRQSGQFIIEGIRELSLAIKSNYTIKSLLYCPELISKVEVDSLGQKSFDVIEISKNVFQKLAYRDTSEGIIAVASSKNLLLDELKFNHENPLILVAESPEKPGNIGALLRTADAANVDAVIIANSKTDLYNPNIIRSSVGCVFTNQIAFGSTTDIIKFLRERDINIYCASLQASKEYQSQDYTKPTAIIVGTEATGLSSEWLENSMQNIVIPMSGEIDSMNVSVAAGILIFEAKRQRNFS